MVMNSSMRDNFHTATNRVYRLKLKIICILKLTLNGKNDNDHPIHDNHFSKKWIEIEKCIAL